MKTNMFHLWLHMVQICSFEKKKKLSIQEKKNPLPPKPGRMVRCVSPYKIALFFFHKIKTTDWDIQRKCLRLEADLDHWKAKPSLCIFEYTFFHLVWCWMATYQHNIGETSGSQWKLALLLVPRRGLNTVLQIFHIFSYTERKCLRILSSESYCFELGSFNFAHRVLRLNGQSV